MVQTRIRSGQYRIRLSRSLHMQAIQRLKASSRADPNLWQMGDLLRLLVAAATVCVVASTGDNTTCPSRLDSGRHWHPKKQQCKMQRLHFLFFGDSLTERGFELGGWGAQVTDVYRHKVTFVGQLCQIS